MIQWADSDYSYTCCCWMLCNITRTCYILYRVILPHVGGLSLDMLITTLNYKKTQSPLQCFSQPININNLLLLSHGHHVQHFFNPTNVLFNPQVNVVYSALISCKRRCHNLSFSCDFSCKFSTNSSTPWTTVFPITLRFPQGYFCLVRIHSYSCVQLAFL